MSQRATEPSTSRARLGTWLRDKYRLDRVLGEGGMAVVYAATHRNKKRFAVKVLHASYSRHTDVRARFLREGYVANSVEHPGAVAVLDDDVAEDGSAFLVMELLDGVSVEDLYAHRGKKLDSPIVLAIVHQLLDVLTAAHARSVIHRDIKPPNLFLTRDGTVKILDFGIARLREVDSGSAATRTGIHLGTPAFMSPEQAGGRASLVDARSDLWSVGATLFYLLAGREVHIGESPQHVVVLAATTDAPSLADVSPDVPAVVTEIVDRALSLDKEARWPNADAMRDAVARAYESLVGESISPRLLREAFLRRDVPTTGAATVDETLAAAPTVPSAPMSSAAPPGSLDGSRTMDPVASPTRKNARTRAVTAAIVMGTVLGVCGAALIVARGRGDSGARQKPSSSTSVTGAAPAVDSPPPRSDDLPRAAVSATAADSSDASPPPPPAPSTVRSRARLPAAPPLTPAGSSKPDRRAPSNQADFDHQ